MPGTKLALDLDFTDTSLPILTDPDPRLSAGSLVLVDPTNPMQPWASGVPASAGKVPNLAWTYLRDLLGSGDADSLAVQFQNALASPHGAMERTAKGGLHGMVKQQAYTATANAYLGLLAVRDYLNANPTHSFYISLWGKLTRADNVVGAGGTLGYGNRMAGVNRDTADGFTLRRYNTSTYGLLPSANRVGQNTKSDGTALTPFHLDGALSALTTPLAASPTLAIWNTAPNTGGQVVQASWVLYSLHIVDLTVAGRTYAQQHDLDHAAYTAAVATAGGRYNGDTHTDPATL